MSSENDSDSLSFDNYEQNEVVWAKVQGYPWWPAYIRELNDKINPILYTVYFFGDNSQYLLDQIVQKYENFNPSSLLSAIKLKQALKQAQQLLNENNEQVAYFNVQQKKQIQGLLIEEPDKSILQLRQKVTENANQILLGKRPRGRPPKNRQNRSNLQKMKSELSQNQQLFATNCTDNKNNENSNKELCQLPNGQQETVKRGKKIIKLQAMMKKGLFKQALDYLHTLHITHQNVVQILQLNIFRQCAMLGNIRSTSKIKEKLKKALISKYFKRQGVNSNLDLNYQQLHYNSIRGRVSRKLKSLLLALSALKWQNMIRRHCKDNNSMYIALILKIFKQLKGKDLNADLQLSSQLVFNASCDLNDLHSL